MNSAHFHLLVNHLPLIGISFGLILLIVAWLRRSRELILASLGVIVVAGLLGLPTYLSGEPAAEEIERYPEVSEALIEAHEESADFAIVTLGLAAGAAAIAFQLTRRRRQIPNSAIAVVALLALGSIAAMIRTANLGGKIRHPEIRGESGPEGNLKRIEDDSHDD